MLAFNFFWNRIVTNHQNYDSTSKVHQFHKHLIICVVARLSLIKEMLSFRGCRLFIIRAVWQDIGHLQARSFWKICIFKKIKIVDQVNSSRAKVAQLVARMSHAPWPSRHVLGRASKGFIPILGGHAKSSQSQQAFSSSIKRAPAPQVSDQDFPFLYVYKLYNCIWIMSE